MHAVMHGWDQRTTLCAWFSLSTFVWFQGSHSGASAYTAPLPTQLPHQPILTSDKANIDRIHVKKKSLRSSVIFRV